MCVWCCGGVPVENRGEGHKNCGETCYNAPRSGAIDQARAEGRTEVVEAMRAFADQLESEAPKPATGGWIAEELRARLARFDGGGS